MFLTLSALRPKQDYAFAYQLHSVILKQLCVWFREDFTVLVCQREYIEDLVEILIPLDTTQQGPYQYQAEQVQFLGMLCSSIV